jgi:hypothetical protein
MENMDAKVQQLFEVVQEKKKEIEDLKSPAWETNCSFGFNKESSSRINLHTQTKISTFVEILAFLMEKKASHDKACQELEVDVEFKWLGYPYEGWLADIKTRMAKVQISSKKEELEILEKKLNTLVSPEMRRKMELEEIENLLK